MPKVATRFAPSPTGPLHIGGVRTALFNWLFSKNQKGSFYLRIEDTDKERSRDEYKSQIIQSLKWIGIEHDDKEYIQSEKINEHKKVAEELLKRGFAYKCYCSEKEINEQKNSAKKKRIPFVYNRKWREPKNLSIPTNVDPVIRFKSKISGNSIIKDLVQGEINISNSTIEDFIIFRQDGSPTYQLSATVDDHLMNITHVIRGDDHKINAFKQKQIYDAMKWKMPYFAHIPLIHSNEGKKLSKRDKASTIDDYIKIGILSDALRNYLLRLGWSFKDKEIFTLDESIKYFTLSGIGKSPSKLDMNRILSMNESYIKSSNEDNLFSNLKTYCEIYKKKIDNKFDDSLIKSLHFLKNKAKTLSDIYDNAQYIMKNQILISPKDLKLLDNLSKKILKDFLKEFESLSNISKDNLDKIIKGLIDKHKTNFKGVGQPLRIALTGSKFGPGIYDIILSLDKDEIVKRLKIVN
jgi:glutamyl-tRNA synthetase